MSRTCIHRGQIQHQLIRPSESEAHLIMEVHKVNLTERTTIQTLLDEIEGVTMAPLNAASTIPTYVDVLNLSAKDDNGHRTADINGGSGVVSIIVYGRHWGD
jgi:hypothetical protein